ncbi:carbon-nitrogen hydrolase family protein [Sphingomicrobium sp. XHP0239]|uniref:carbon-nitrogen hydrolase family protein n=1 Tax=Sphingomicrobium maritimum TaxID=3133972 RepID=UPI0031CC3B43
MTRVALYQSNSGIDAAANAEALVDAAGRAADGGAAMLFTPEMVNLLDRDRRRAAEAIVPEHDDATVAAACRAAGDHGLWIHLGSVAVATDDGKWVNRSILVDPSGSIMARYDKMHLFDVDVGPGNRWRESDVYRAGQRAVRVKDTPVGAMGMTICYDLRFPALFARLAEAGAKVVTVPAAFTVPTGEAHWHVLLRARAIEAGMFVIAAAQDGVHADGRETYGHSLVVDPWGEVLLDMGNGAGVGFADIDLDRIDAVRERIPAISHRREVARLDD